MVRTSFAALVLLAVVALAGCAKPAPEFSVFAKDGVDFTVFKTYQWQAARPESAIMRARSELVNQFIVQTVEEELAVDGLTKAEPGDLVVRYRITVSPQKGLWQTFAGAESATPGTYNQRSAEAQASAVDEHKLHQGVLVIELVDRNSNVVWAGRASVVYSQAQPGRAVIAVRKIMENYPPVK
jgi:hypothetical protein